jgi:hypothetical protein
MECFHFLSSKQRVLNDLLRNRLSRRRMIWLLPHQLPTPSPVCWHKKGEGVGRSQIIRQRANGWSSVNHSILSGGSQEACLENFSIDASITWRSSFYFCLDFHKRQIITEQLIKITVHSTCWILKTWFSKKMIKTIIWCDIRIMHSAEISA